ncbi:MAG: nicotinate phosphoribosyltransferase [Thermomicrobiales bacterium]
MPPTALPGATSSGLLVDRYHIDSAYVSWATGQNPVVTFDLYTRKLPFGGAYLLVAGLEIALAIADSWSLGDAEIDYISTMAPYDPAFLRELRSLSFRGSIAAIREGEIAFANEPLMRVTAPFREALMLESAMLHAIGVSTLIATKASRVVNAAAGRTVAEFGFRRAQAPHIAARSAIIGGCASTSFVDAARLFGLPTSGTIPHALVELFPTEREAFAAVAATLDRYSLLLDTYDVASATATAIDVAVDARERNGHLLASVRLDSGDLAADAFMVRGMLDASGLNDVKILASGDLDEWKIRDIAARQAPIDGFGAGTSLSTGNGSLRHEAEGTALGGVFKLVWVDGGFPPVKIAGEKSTWPGIKQVVRRGDFDDDVIQLATEDVPSDGRALLTGVMRDGDVVAGAFEPLDVIRSRAERELSALPDRYHDLDDPPVYPVRWSEALLELQRSAMERHGGVPEDIS